MGWDPWGDIQDAVSNVSNSFNSGLDEFGHTVSGWIGDLGGASKPAVKQAPAMQMPQPPQNSQSQVSSYPAYPNSFGLGGPMENQAPAAPAAPPLTGTPQKQASDISNNSQGFNPWSLTGEANSR